ncbi:carcinoembryonic antigen-related cell adhesion molecule 7-like [Suncus etruscus]|uniref:carcinoembryonic antigen-related cell adhesion molecule 7-like n=1 Tax=Suncus etruscus TaxID=109475 RepID=UPI002110B08E|nr:carcinoembryonic antigen-related cell adhesion molecule 7-like [Suncus etruscus]
MEPTSGPAHRGALPWHMLLLTASLLTFWSPPTTAQVTVESVPPNAAEGKEVLLLAHKLPEKFISLTWYKRKVEDGNIIAELKENSENVIKGPAHSGRETLYRNGSLLIQNLTLMDAEKYYIQVQTKFQPFLGKIELHVYALLPKPQVKANNWGILEHEKSVVLTCESESSDMTYRWFVNFQPVQPSARLQLSPDNRTLIVFHITRNDTGPYECETSNPPNVQRSNPFTLHIFYLTRIAAINITVSEPVAPPSIRASNPTVTEGAGPVVLTCLTNDTGVSTRWYLNDKDLQPEERRKLSADNRTLTLQLVWLADVGDYQCEVSNPISSQKSDHIRLQVTPILDPGPEHNSFIKDAEE